MTKCKHALIASVLLAACTPEHTGDSGTDASDGGASSETSATISNTTASSTSATTDATSISAGDCAADPGGAGECDVGCQDCPPGEKCVLVSTSGMGTSVCTSLPNSPKGALEPCALLGDPADDLDDCDRGLVCVAYPLFTDSRCIPYCKGDAGDPQCPTEARCLSIDDKPICAPVCDPRLESECPGGCRPVDQMCSGCFPMPEASTFSCWFPPPLEYSAGSPCPFGECLDSLFCAPPARVLGCDESTPCCTEYCDLDAPACPAGSVCTSVFEVGQAPALLETLGACLTP